MVKLKKSRMNNNTKKVYVSRYPGPNAKCMIMKWKDRTPNPALLSLPDFDLTKNCKSDTDDYVQVNGFGNIVKTLPSFINQSFTKCLLTDQAQKPIEKGIIFQDFIPEK